jgi:hypothetical protein
MSNQFAIAAVTRTLRNLLNAIMTSDFSALPSDTRPTAEIVITTRPPDKARDGDESRNQVNLFLYHTAPSPALRNMDPPNRTRPGETAFPPLALDLYYLVTAYGQDSNELIANVLLGTAMSILHDHAVLSRAEIESALAASGLHEQFERIRITPQAISQEDISKLWSGFQFEYRLSAAYHVSAVLIDSKRPSRSPLPVLQRGSDDRGAYVLAAPVPSLNALILPNLKSSAEPGDTLTLKGINLDSQTTTVRFSNPRLVAPIERAPLPGGAANQIQVRIPDIAEDNQFPSIWAAGFYTLLLVIQRLDLPTWTTNELPFALAPQVTSITPTTAPAGDITLQLTCIPQVRAGQRVALLFDNRQVPATSITTPPDPTAETTLVFDIANVAAGEYVVRLRVDGADSIPVDFSTVPPEFDAAQRVTITP